MLSEPLNRVLEWLHAGYPEGIPPNDYLPLMALLTRGLTRGEAEEVVRDLIAEAGDDDVARSDVGAALSKTTDRVPSEDDIDRVARRLEAAGYPVFDDYQADSDADAPADAVSDEPGRQ